MKKLLLLIGITFLIATSSYSQTVRVENLPVMIGSGMAAQAQMANVQNAQAPQLQQLPFYNLPANNGLNKALFLSDVLQNEPRAFSTRLQPFPTDSNEIDTARVIYDVNDSTNQNNYFYIGDTQMPTNVVDQNGNSVFKLNGYVQILPSLSWYIPSLTNGTFTIDSVKFWLYSFPNSPVTSGYLFTLFNASTLNMPNFGSSTFNPSTFELDYNAAIYNNLTAAYSVDASYINSRIQKQGTGYTIQPSTISFNNADLTPVRDWSNSDRIMVILAKDNLNDLQDTTDLIGAWEWIAPYQQPFAAAVRHYSQGVDSLSFLSSTILPMKPATTSPYYNQWLQMYPTYMKEKEVRKDYRFVIYGRYSGDYNPNSVKEVENAAEAFDLSQNYPNPVNTKTTISFSIKGNGLVTLDIYNSLGEKVANLVNQNMSIGTYTADFDASNLPSGTYYYTLTAGQYSKTLPMVIVK